MTSDDKGAPHGRQAGIGQAAILVVAAFMPIMAIVSLAPAVPSIVQHFSATPNATLLAPLMVSTPGLMIALLSPIAGVIVDRYGRRPLFIWATLFYGVFGMAPFFLDDLRAIFATRLGLGVTEAAVLTVVNTLIADYFEPVMRRRVLAAQSVVGPVFGSSVIFLAGNLTEKFWNGAFLIYSATFPIFILALLLIFEPKRDAAQVSANPAAAAPAKAAFPWGAVATYAAVTYFAANLYYIFIIQTGRAFGEIGVNSPAQVGAYVAIASVGVPIGGMLFALLGKRSATFLTGIFLLLLGAGLFLIGYATDYRTMLGASFIQQMGAGMTVPTLIYWAQSVLPFDQRGRGMGIWCTAFFLGQFTSPLLMGQMESIGGSVLRAFSLNGAIGLVGAVVALGFAVLRRRTAAPSA